MTTHKKKSVKHDKEKTEEFLLESKPLDKEEKEKTEEILLESKRAPKAYISINCIPNTFSIGEVIWSPQGKIEVTEEMLKSKDFENRFNHAISTGILKKV